MAVESAAQRTLLPDRRGAPRCLLHRDETASLAARIRRQSVIAMPLTNALTAAITAVFVVFVVPLPGKPLPEPTGVIGAAVGIMIGWVGCHAWSRRAAKPILDWLERGGPPTEHERARTIRWPLHQTMLDLAVWALAAAAFGTMHTFLSESVVAGLLVSAMVLIGGLTASALSYFVTEKINRPAIALAMEHDPPGRALLPGIGARIYLAWEFGTAVAVAGMAVVEIAYLAGGGFSPRRVAATVIFLAGVALTFGLVTLLIAIRSVSHPVHAIREAMARVEEGETEVTVPVDDGGEIGLLQAGFNRMVAGLRERDRVRDLFGRHVGEEVARSALEVGEPLDSGEQLGGEVREAAVLFVDVIGSTSFAASRDPREVVETLNRFFSIVVEVVTVHGGWVNKFEGDAALCAFGAPTDHPDAAGAALSAARELHGRLSRELDGFDAAIGLSAGQVVAGNIGAAQRYEYTVVGDPVNEAARLTELAKTMPSGLLASEEIVRRASSREASRWQLGEPVVLRGRAAPTRVAALT